jgi:hypothetical protein
MNQPRGGEIRKRVRDQIKEMSQQELYDTTAAYINAEIVGAKPGSYVSKLPRAQLNSSMLETFDAFEHLNEAYLKDVLVGDAQPASTTSIDALTGDDLRQRFTTLLQKSQCR